MAYQMAFSDSYGNEYDAAYFTVTGVYFDPINQKASIDMAGYKDIAAMQGGKQPFATYHIDLSPDTFQEFFGPIAQQVFDAITGAIAGSSMGPMLQNAQMVP